MVEDSIDDPTRIAQLLSSELTGLETGPLAAVEVVDANQSATPSPDGTPAYGIAFEDRRVGTVFLYPDAAVVALTVDAALVPQASDLPLDATDEETRLRVESGVAVKRAVDVLRKTLRNLSEAQ